MLQIASRLNGDCCVQKTCSGPSNDDEQCSNFADYPYLHDSQIRLQTALSCCILRGRCGLGEMPEDVFGARSAIVTRRVYSDQGSYVSGTFP